MEMRGFRNGDFFLLLHIFLDVFTLRLLGEIEDILAHGLRMDSIWTGGTLDMRAGLRKQK